MNIKKYIAELKKRHVFKAGLAYLIGAWVFTEVASLVLDSFDAPPHIIRIILIILVIGFPIWLVFSWVYDLTPEGITKTSNADQTVSQSPKINQRLNRAIIAMLSIAIILLVVNQARNAPHNRTQNVERASKGEAKLVAENSMDLIAVLPFINTKSDPETDYLGFAMADQIIGGLVYLKNITVRPSGSIRKYEKQAIDPKEVGADLQVDYVLIGNYLKEANTIRLNIELINVHSNKIIWRKPLEVEFQSAFKLQDIVAQQVIEGMNVQFTQKELNRIRKDVPVDPMAYEFFLRSVSYDYTNEGDQLAVEMLNRSIELDSTYAPAYNQFGERTRRLEIYGMITPEETKSAENSYLKALYLNDELISALGNLSRLYTETNRIVEAVELTKRIVEINPNNAVAHFSTGYIYRYAGMNDAAIEKMEKAVTLDPNNQGFRSIIITYIFAGNYKEAFEAGKLFKESAYFAQYQGEALLRMGKYNEALAYFSRALHLEQPGKGTFLMSTGMKAYIEENIEEGLSAIRKFEQLNIPDAEAWYFNASMYGLLGEKEGCIRCLRRAVDDGFFNYPLMNTDFFLDLARDDPEFQKILEKAKKKHLAFKERFF